MSTERRPDGAVFAELFPEMEPPLFISLVMVAVLHRSRSLGRRRRQSPRSD